MVGAAPGWGSQGNLRMLASHKLDLPIIRPPASAPKPPPLELEPDLELLEKLPHVTRLEVQSIHGHVSTVYLLGTAHISSVSCDEVRALIQGVRPQLVMVELCQRRTAMLRPLRINHVPTPAEMMAEYRDSNTPLFGIIYSWILAKVAEHLDVMPGEEFRVALQEGHGTGAAVVLGDRGVRVTLLRVWAALSRWEKVRFVWNLLCTGFSLPSPEEMRQLVEEIKDADMLTEMIKELAHEFPSLLRPLIEERDEYMVCTARAAASQLQGVSRVVGVVGAGHVPGIRENWDEEIDLEGISALPPKRAGRAWGAWGVGVLALAGTAGAAVVVLRARRR